MGLELEIMCPLLLNIENQENARPLNEKSEEIKQIQSGVANHEQSEGTVVKEDIHQTDETQNSPLWSMYFDGSCTRNNTGAGVWIRNTVNNHTECISCKLNFLCSNNIAEYESLLLGLHLLKNLGARRINVYGDSELIIRQVNGEYNTNHP